MKKTRKQRVTKIMWILLSIICIFFVIVFIFLQQDSFGSTPSGERLNKINNSTNYKDGKFQNQSYTPQITENSSYLRSMFDFIFNKDNRSTPKNEIPTIKTDLLELDRNKDILIWFGHSSYLIQIDGKRILVDPVLDGAASPVPFINKPYKGTDLYKPQDIPEIDYIIISHDHWDHLDYKTIMELKPRTGKIICGLGVGEHFEQWNFNKKNIIELNWNEKVILDDGFEISCLPARHFSGRGLKPNQSLWASFLLHAPTFNIYIGGDSGYDSHYHSISKLFESIDLAILENGQYSEDWKYIHMMPEQVLQAAKDLQAKKLFTVHHAKFTLANHAWDEPLKRITEANKSQKVNLITPMIGEIVNLKDSTQTYTRWWESID